MADIRWSSSARRDLATIDDYYREIDPDLANRIGLNILNAADFLRIYPEAGPISIRGDRRQWRARKTPYLIFCRVLQDHVRILRVMHERQDQQH